MGTNDHRCGHHRIVGTGRALARPGAAGARCGRRDGHAFAQQPATDASRERPSRRRSSHDLVGPIALYPDDLVGIVLPASTYPLQVVQAARFSTQRKKNPSLKPTTCGTTPSSRC